MIGASGKWPWKKASLIVTFFWAMTYAFFQVDLQYLIDEKKWITMR